MSINRRLLPVAVIMFLVAIGSFLVSRAGALQSPPQSAPGTWSVSESDKNDDIAGPVNGNETYRVHNNLASAATVKVQVKRGTTDVGEPKLIDPGDSTDVELEDGQSLWVEYIDGPATGTYEDITP